MRKTTNTCYDNYKPIKTYNLAITKILLTCITGPNMIGIQRTKDILYSGYIKLTDSQKDKFNDASHKFYYEKHTIAERRKNDAQLLLQYLK